MGYQKLESAGAVSWRPFMRLGANRGGGGVAASITGFDYGNPVVRHIAFTRLGDRP